MAKLPQLSSSRPAATPQLTGPLTLPTDFKAPPPNMVMSRAFASIAETTGNIAQYKQRLFDEEQDSLFAVSASALETNVLNTLTEQAKKLNVEIMKGSTVLADSEAPSTALFNDLLKDDTLARNIPQYAALTDKRKEKLLTNARIKIARKAHDTDVALRSLSKQKVGEAALNIYDKELLDVELYFNENGNINENYENTWKSFVGKAIEVHGIDATDVINKKAKNIVNRWLSLDKKLEFQKDLALYDSQSSKVLDLFKDREGKSLISDEDIPKIIKDYRGVIIGKDDTAKDARDKFFDAQNQAVLTIYETSKPPLEYENLEDLATMYKVVADRGLLIPEEERSDKLNDAIRDSVIQEAVFLELSKYKSKTELSTVDKLAWSKYDAELELEKIPADTKDSDLLMMREKNLKVIEDAGKLIENLKNPVLIKEALARTTLQERSLKGILEGLQGAFTTSGNMELEGVKLPQYLIPIGLDLSFKARGNPEQISAMGYKPELLDALRTITVNSLPSNTKESDIFYVATGYSIDFESRPLFTRDSSGSLGDMSAETAAIFGINSAVTKLQPMVSKLYQQSKLELLSNTDGKFFKLSQKSDLTDDEKSDMAEILRRRTAAKMGRTYHNYNGKPLFLNQVQYPPNITSDELNSFLEAGRVFSPSLAYSSSASDGVNELVFEYLKKPDYTAVYSSTAGIPKLPVETQEEYIERFKNIEWGNTRTEVKNTLIRAAERGLGTAASSARLVKDAIADMRKNAKIVVDGSGNLSFKMKPNSEASFLYSKPVGIEGIRSFVGSDGIQLYNKYQNNFFPVRFPPETLLPESMRMESNLPIPETAMRDLDIKDSLKNFMGTVKDEDLEDIGADGKMLKYTEDKYSLTRLVSPVVTTIDPAAADSEADPRRQGIEKASEFNLDAAHVLTRSFAFIFAGMRPTTFDGNANLDRASVSFNRYLQRNIEIAVKDEIRDWIIENKPENLTAEWTVGTYSEPIATFDKYEGFTDSPTAPNTIINLQSTLVFKDSEGNVVKTWDWEVEDPTLITIMQRSNIFNPAKN